MPTVEDPNDKVREQIEEILEKDEARNPGVIRIARPTPPRKVKTGTPVWYPTPEKLIVAGMVIMLVAAVTKRFVLPLVVVGFALSGIGYYVLIMRRRRAKYGSRSGGGRPGDMSAQYWRGKRIEPRSSSKDDKGKILEFPDPKRDQDRR